MFTHIIVGQGLTLPLIQKDNLTRRHVHSAFWALVVFQWVAQLANLVLFWAMAWRKPRLAFSLSSLKELLYTGSGAFLSQLGGFAISRADTLLTGVFFGPIAVVLCRLSDRLVQLLVTLLSMVTVSQPIRDEFRFILNTAKTLRFRTNKHS